MTPSDRVKASSIQRRGGGGRRRRTSCSFVVAITLLLLLLSLFATTTTTTTTRKTWNDDSIIIKDDSDDDDADYYLTASDYVSPWQQYRPRSSKNNNNNNNNNHPLLLPPPMQLLQEYIQQHNADAVRREWKEQQQQQQQHDHKYNHTAHYYSRRRYLVAHYSCPDSAGNWMHDVTASVTWAILMNRTLLWKYMDSKECLRLRHAMEWPFELERCTLAANVVSDCTPNILTRASWVLSYDDFQKEYYTTYDPHDDDEQQTNTTNTTTNYHILPRLATTDYVERNKKNNHQHPPLDDYDYYSQFLVVRIYPWLKRLTHLHRQPRARHHHLSTPTAYQQLETMQTFGLPFWHGLVWRSVFDFAPSIKQQVRQEVEKIMMMTMLSEEETSWQQQTHQQQQSTNVHQSTTNTTKPLLSSILSIGLHSRHIDAQDNGCLIEREQACLMALLKEQQQRQQQQQLRKEGSTPTVNNTTAATLNTTTFPTCLIVVLTDRTCTKRNVKAWLRWYQPQCKVVTLASAPLHNTNDERTTTMLQQQQQQQQTITMDSTTSSNSTTAPAATLTIRDPLIRFGAEHGPSAGSGFFADLLLASLTVRTGMIGELETSEGNRWRSSSELIEDLVAYARMMEYWQRGNDDNYEYRDNNNLEEFLECTLGLNDADTKPPTRKRVSSSSKFKLRQYTGQTTSLPAQ